MKKFNEFTNEGWFSKNKDKDTKLEEINSKISDATKIIGNITTKTIIATKISNNLLKINRYITKVNEVLKVLLILFLQAIAIIICTSRDCLL